MYQCNVRRYFICEESFLRPLMNTCVVFLFFFFFAFFFLSSCRLEKTLGEMTNAGGQLV